MKQKIEKNCKKSFEIPLRFAAVAAANENDVLQRAAIDRLNHAASSTYPPSFP
jgi:hypothetical protein